MAHRPKLPASLGGAPRVDRYEGKTCAVEGCERKCRALNRHCQMHARIIERVRDPLGRMPRKSEIKPYKELAAHALKEYGLAEHPAIKAAEAWLIDMIRNPDRVSKPFSGHFRRLYNEGVTGREILLTMLGIYGLREVGYAKAFGGGGVDDAVFFAALGNHVLRLRKLNWQKHAVTGRTLDARIPGHIREGFGRVLAERVGAVALLFWQRAEKERRDREGMADSIRDALQRNPL